MTRTKNCERALTTVLWCWSCIYSLTYSTHNWGNVIHNKKKNLHDKPEANMPSMFAFNIYVEIDQIIIMISFLLNGIPFNIFLFNYIF